MKDDNTPKVTSRTRTPSRKIRLRLDTARKLKHLNLKHKTVRQRKKESKLNAEQPNPEKHVLVSRIPRPKKNTLVRPPTATTKYKRRQLDKTWLPTHLWHTKRAHMTRPTEPLWRMAIPLNPTEKSYRPSHRAAGTKGCIAWDTSYMSTVSLRGTETALDSMLRALGFSPEGLSQALQKKWKAGTRSASGWVSERDNEKRPIAPVTVIWFPVHQYEEAKPAPAETGDEMQLDAVVPSRAAVDVQPENVQSATPSVKPEQAKHKPNASKLKPKLDHQILIRIHPSAFHQFWEETLKVAKIQKPQVLVEDLRFEIGSIDVQGPGSTEALLGVLRPFPGDRQGADSMSSLWTSLAGLTNPSILPQNAMLCFDIVDPRLNHPPKRVKIPHGSESCQMDELLVSWPIDKLTLSSSLLSYKSRWMISKSLPSQKAINRRRTLAPPGQSPTITSKDPRIPALLLASRAQNNTTNNVQGTWTVLLPWSCVDPVWRSLMYYPQSSGGTPRFGGLKQKQQLAFEHNVPWFPGDFPGTEAGKAWENTESEKRFDNWIRRPARHRIAWDRLDLGLERRGEVGRGWACDWEFLLRDTEKVDSLEATPQPERATTTSTSTQGEVQRLLTQRQRKAAKAKEAEEAAKQARRRNTSSPESEGDPDEIPTLTPELKFNHLSLAKSTALLKNPPSTPLPQHPALMTVRITLLDKGTPSAAARIYRLPFLRNSKPSAPPNPTQPTANGDGKPQESQPPSWSSHGPPPAQPFPATSSTHSSSSSQVLRIKQLRARWLALDTHSPSPSSMSHKPIPKTKQNRFNLPRHQAAYPRESLAKINVLPSNAPKEIVDNWGPESAFGRGDGEIPKQKPPAPKEEKKGRNRKGRGKAIINTTNGAGKDGQQEMIDKQPNCDTTTSAHLDNNGLEGPLRASATDTDPFFPSLHFLNPSLHPPAEWDKHVPCPDPGDLIGFVTSGGYNLAEGRGTAVGSIWIQRILQGWREEEEQEEGGGGGQSSAKSSTAAGNAGVGPSGREKGKAKARTRRLCVVRNAGESVGRLGIWELCG